MATVTTAATVSAAVAQTASSSAGTASQPVAGKADTSPSSIWGTGPAPRSARASDVSSSDIPSSSGISRRDSIQNMLLSALASSGPAPFGPMFSPPLVAGAAAGGMAVEGPGPSAAWQPRRHLSTTAAALPTLRVPARSAPSQSRSGSGSSAQQEPHSQPGTPTPTPATTRAITESSAATAASRQSAADQMRQAATSAAVTAASKVGSAGDAAPDIHIHGGWLGVARQVVAGLSALSFVSAVSVTVVCGAIKAAAAVSGPLVVYAATSTSSAAANAASAASSAAAGAVTLHVFGAPPAYAVAAALAGLLLGLVVSAVDSFWAARGGSGGGNGGSGSNWSAAA
ncbi:hypothetical protein HXX76_004995 [Chlamydomonas incerta]|uniref:Uncharacterized protein n=1 Tax=Chlamydomonas incerta TaxID=51695 RepID=A0A835W520_CHLIN|nr:hypothetical protein HXX76_004995 [Chlamydomonas incerta]|eukprot:KAG2439645.1 hypothetical protein HXX76_004995 [Chlamydomonas incerta]